MYITVNELASILNKTKRQIQYMISNRIAQPINPDTHRRDGGYRFSSTEVERLKEIYNRNDLSLKEASRIVGITPQYLNQLALVNKIQSSMVSVGHRLERRFTKEDCESILVELKQKKHSKRNNQYGKRLSNYSNGVRLFKHITLDDQKYVIVNTDPLSVLNEKGETVYINSIDINIERWIDKPYVTKKGFVEFQIPIPKYVEHPAYNLFYTLIKQIGPKNIQFFETPLGDYYIRTRQSKIHLCDDQFDLLQKFILKGRIEKTADFIFLSSDFDQVLLDIPYDTHKKVATLAHKNQQSVNDLFLNIIEEYLGDLDEE
ncbi:MULTISPECIES: hypothetical protein [Metabacillus]|uniref:hypothetical protein n=1 Tax=Metabacillus TaxID=2675233 RepID=UPI001B93F89F|nr:MULTISPECIES: hypothetical protein [Metabacillus]MCM3164697.1 hypothetical protein [Metabacillus litoralis]UGB33625.1 hypothetical protein LPC09_27205 [Metabacillus sp. B2-18]